MILKNIDNNSFPKLDHYIKEQIRLSVYSLHLTEANEYMVFWRNVCSCCYGDRKSFFYIINEEGEFLRAETEEFYKAQKTKEVLKFSSSASMNDFKTLAQLLKS